MHKGTNQVSCIFFKLIISLQVLMELFISVTLTSPYLSPSPFRKHAQTCHLRCSAFLTHSNDICSPYKGLKASPDLKVEGQVTSYTPSGTSPLTWQLITSPEVAWAGLLCSMLHCHKIQGALQWYCELWGKKWQSCLSTGKHLCKFEFLVFIKLTISSHWEIKGNSSILKYLHNSLVWKY